MTHHAICAPETDVLRAKWTQTMKTPTYLSMIIVLSRNCRPNIGQPKQTAVRRCPYLAFVSRAKCCRPFFNITSCWTSHWKMLRDNFLSQSQSHIGRSSSDIDPACDQDLDISLLRAHLPFVATRQGLSTNNFNPNQSLWRILLAL